MPDFALPAVPAKLLPAVLAVSQAAVLLLRPHYASDTQELADFHLEYLTPAAQQLTGLAAEPGSLVPLLASRVFSPAALAFCRRVFEAPEAGAHVFAAPTAGSDPHAGSTAQRADEWLVVGLAAPAGHDPLPVASAAPASQPATSLALPNQLAAIQELVAHTAAYHPANAVLLTTQQQGLAQQILRQVPAAIATLTGREHRFSFANARY